MTRYREIPIYNTVTVTGTTTSEVDRIVLVMVKGVTVDTTILPLGTVVVPPCTVAVTVWKDVKVNVRVDVTVTRTVEVTVVLTLPSAPVVGGEGGFEVGGGVVVDGGLVV